MRNKKILTLVFVVAFVTLLAGCFPAPNQAPIITSEPVKTATVGEDYLYDVNATDPDEDTLTYSLITKPAGMIINSATGLIKWKPTKKGNYTVVVKVSDGDFDITQSFTIAVSEEEPGYIPPKLTSIVVKPKTMTLFVGESKTIKSVTSYYSDGSKGFIPLGDCTYVSDNEEVAIVGDDGAFTVLAIGVGTATITVEYKGKADEITVTVSELVQETITIRWLEDQVWYEADGSLIFRWVNNPIDPAILILDDGGYYLTRINEFFNFTQAQAEEMKLEGNVAIDETGKLSGNITYIWKGESGLLTEDSFVGTVNIIIYEEGDTYFGGDYDGTMVGTYTQWRYKFGTAEDVTAKYPLAIKCEGFNDKWFIGHTDHTAHGEVLTH